MARRLSPVQLLSNTYAIPFVVAMIQFIIQVSSHSSYGYFRDELYYIACSKHLALGYVDEPPLSIAILALNRWILGDSLQAMRFCRRLRAPRGPVGSSHSAPSGRMAILHLNCERIAFEPMLSRLQEYSGWK